MTTASSVSQQVEREYYQRTGIFLIMYTIAVRRDLLERHPEAVSRLNVLGPIIAMQAVIPVMRAQGGGSIVNINSGTAFVTIPQYSVYSSSKRALLGFSLAARAELEKDRIVVSEI